MRLAPLRSTCVYLNNNARYDRPKISHELQVNVPRTMGILRDDSDVDSADFDSEKRLADKPVITRCGRQVKAWIRFDAQAVTKHKASSLKEQRHCLHILKS